MSIDMSQLSDWLEKHSSNGPVAIITHKNGDMDTIGSGIVLCSAISADSKTCGIYIGSMAKKLLDGADVDEGAEPGLARRMSAEARRCSPTIRSWARSVHRVPDSARSALSNTARPRPRRAIAGGHTYNCLLYTSDAADE